MFLLSWSMLIPALQLVGISDPAASIAVKDATGDYSGSNPGGYGSPNPAKADITSTIIQLNTFSNPGVYLVKLLADASDLFTTDGLTLTPADFGGGGVFEDGVYDVKYNLAFAGSNITFTAKSKQFTYTGADTAFANAVGFIITAYDTKKIFYIDNTKTLSSTGGYVTEALPSFTNPTAIQVVYEGDLKFIITKAGNTCLLNDIALWSDEGCHGTDFRDVWKRYKMKIAMETKFTGGYIYDAHNLAVKLSSYCNQTSCGC